MPAKLGNAKHEEFSLLVAKGIAQGESYRRVYGKKNDPAASRLVRRHADRISELKEENYKAATLPALTGAPTTLEEMGVTKIWIAEQYHAIYLQAKDAEKFADATKILASLERMRADEIEEEEHTDKPPAALIDINTLANVLDKFANVLAIAKQAPGQPMEDVPPEQPCLSTAQAQRAAQNPKRPILLSGNKI